MGSTIMHRVWNNNKNILCNNFIFSNGKSQVRTVTATNTEGMAEKHSTIDTSEVEKHSKLTKEWWDPKGPMKALHSMNAVRVPFVRDGLVQVQPNERTYTPLKNKKILDVGCGGGILSEALARIGANVTGIDASKELIELAKEHSIIDLRLENNRPQYICTTVEEHTPTHIDHYDGIVASEVIEHVNNKELFVKSCVQALKPGGRIFFTTPNRTRISQIAGIYLAEYVLNLVPRGTHQYDNFITPNELSFLLERNNCHVESIYGLFYHFLTNNWQWIESQVFLFALQAVKTK